MTTTRIYASTDASAPVLTGAVASILNLLDKCLVDGYGSKTAAGWTRAYVGTNVTAYRNSTAAGGTGMHVRVDHTGSGTGGAREALVRGYLTMSDINTGTIETPLAATVASSSVWRVSNTVDSTARAWILIADELTFYLCVDTGTNSASRGHGIYGAGDFKSLVAGDPYRFFVVGRESQQGASAQGTHYGICTPANLACVTPSAYGFWLARGHAGTGNPIRAGIMMPAMTGDAQSVVIGALTGSIAATAPGSGLAHWVQAVIGTEGGPRGFLRGVYAPQTSRLAVALGTSVVNPPGLTGTLTELRHYGHTNSATDNSFDGHISVLSDQSWPV